MADKNAENDEGSAPKKQPSNIITTRVFKPRIGARGRNRAESAGQLVVGVGSRGEKGGSSWMQRQGGCVTVPSPSSSQAQIQSTSPSTSASSSSSSSIDSAALQQKLSAVSKKSSLGRVR